MRLDVFRWQIKDDYPDTLRSDDTTQPFSTIYIKALDCAEDDYPTWMGFYDYGSPHNLDELTQQLDVYRQQGLGAVPWGVARGKFPAAEGEMAGQCAARETNGVYILDLEPYSLFWESRDPEDVRRFLAAFKQAGGRELWISTDSRQGKPQEVSLPVWLADPVVTRIMPQAYWTDFQLPWQAGIEASYLPLEALGIPVDKIYPTYPLNATVEDLRAAIAWSQLEPSFGGISLWRRGIAKQTTLDSLLGDPQPVFSGGTPATPPAPPPAPSPTPPGETPEAAFARGVQAGLAEAVRRIQTG